MMTGREKALKTEDTEATTLGSLSTTTTRAVPSSWKKAFRTASQPAGDDANAGQSDAGSTEGSVKESSWVHSSSPS
jgi:hypothetical protein